MDFTEKKVLVCGMARSGVAAAKLLCKKGAVVILQDLKERDQLEGITELEQMGITIYAGKNPDDILLEQDLLVVSPGIPGDLPFLQRAREMGIPILSEVELAFTQTPCPVAAITGTNGKTTTTALTGELMQAVFPNTAVVGNIGVPYSEKVLDLTPKDWVVAEISSFQLEEIKTFSPRISAVLNISPDHLNRHKTMENYIAMKERIFENQRPSDFCVLNYEDVVCREMAEKTKAKVFFFSSQRKLSEGIYLEGDTIWVNWQGEAFSLISTDEVKLLGIHNYENIMAAAAMAHCAGISQQVIKKILQEFKGVPHRIEYVATIDGVEYYNDSKGTNADAAIRAVLAMKRPIVLLGGGYDKGADFTSWVETFPGRVKHLVLTGATAKQIRDTAQENGFFDTSLCETFSEAVALCKEKAAEGDCVLLSPACASWGMFQDYEQRGEVFKSLVLED